MFPELQELAEHLAISDGELLAFAREVTENGLLRPIDRLSRSERELLVAELSRLAEPLPV
jgi:hypothetical protein